MATIRTPVPGYTGPGPGGVHFMDGATETDDEAVIGYCRGAGYEVDGEVLNPLRGVGTVVDARDVTVRRVGAALRDAAVDPRAGDHQAPTGAGENDPHGPAVTAPGLTAPIPPPAPQEETILQEQGPGVLQRPAQAAPVAEWRAWALSQTDEGDEAGRAKIEKATKAELVKTYGAQGG
ncbi:hypothetical protein ACFVVU_23665 [Kitasatospora sp. NPDC057965]|uniref:hypothetical protein n=1 Tax=Kitasatospora sp. NPDC057965 TaxID=3346291 RepID=UPI0036D9BEE4